MDEQKLTRLLLYLDVCFHVVPPFVSLWVLAVMSPKRLTFEHSPLLPQRGGEGTRITQHKKKGGDASQVARESQKPSARRYKTPIPKSRVFRKNPVFERAYTEMHTHPEYSICTVRKSGRSDGSVTTVHVPSSFRPSQGSPWMAI